MIVDHAAIVEIVERYAPGYGIDGIDGNPPIAPNLLRINGDDIWSAGDHFVEVGPITMTLGSDAAVVPVTFLARLTDGTDLPPEDGPPAATLAVTEDAVTLNGKEVAVDEHGVTVLHRHLGTRYARIRMALYARRIIVDSESSELGPSSLLPYSSPRGMLYPSVADAEAILTMAKVRTASLTGNKTGEPSTDELRAASRHLAVTHPR